ncbi:hypothetical protein DOS80_03180, partial [Staphylococcus felis]
KACLLHNIGNKPLKLYTKPKYNFWGSVQIQSSLRYYFGIDVPACFLRKQAYIKLSLKHLFIFK